MEAEEKAKCVYYKEPEEDTAAVYGRMAEDKQHEGLPEMARHCDSGKDKRSVRNRHFKLRCDRTT